MHLDICFERNEDAVFTEDMHQIVTITIVKDDEDDFPNLRIFAEQDITGRNFPVDFMNGAFSECTGRFENSEEAERAIKDLVRELDQVISTWKNIPVIKEQRKIDLPLKSGITEGQGELPAS